MRKAATLRELIERLLKEFGGNASALCRKAGMSAAALSLIIAGKRQPTVATLQKLLQAAGKNWAWLDENLVEAKLKPRLAARRVGRPRSDRE